MKYDSPCKNEKEQEKIYYCPICDKEYIIIVNTNSTFGYCRECGHHIVIQ